MDTGKARLEVDYSINLVTMAFVVDMPDVDARVCLLEAFNEIPKAYLYDWLFDFTALSQVISAETALETGAEWRRIAQGRDVGRRSAVISRHPKYQTLIDETQKTMPFRSLAFFDTIEEGQHWLQSLGNACQDDAQFI